MQSLDLVGLSATLVYVVVFAAAAGETSAFLGLIVPGEAVIITAGAVAGQGHLQVGTLIAVIVAGAIVGDAIGYVLGRRYGFRWADRLSRRRRTWSRRLCRVRGWMSGSRGGLAIMSGRFVGYVRPLVPFTAGAAGMRYRVFLAFSAPATAAWATGSVLLGVFFGASGERILRTFGIGAVTIATLVVAAVVAIWWVRRRRRATTRPAAASVPSESGEESRQAA